MRTVLILGGGDWNDVSVDDILVPNDLDLKVAHKEWTEWYKEHRGREFLKFDQWLVKFKNCKPADLEVFDEY